ncbi:microtubule-associated protein RP/EB family member 1-like [Phoenix dactylifera]|uniref:Microtubule-associated protein RP/EB family member 1-like n=1 Tax=Phoenix dactylifera TaxID=42345 RepID=A0A8B7D076_PHODC|nr:microtubule-associated protein RP/EB family member 1-like [Phoenix dactylifera]
MAPKKKNKGRGHRSKTPAQTSASDPKPTATSPSTSAPTGGATTTSLVPSSAFPSAPPTTTTTTQLIPSAPPQPTSLLPSSVSKITTTQPLPSAQPLPIQETHQERTSCISDGATTSTDLAGPSTAPSASLANAKTLTLLSIADDLMSVLAPRVAVQSVKKEDPLLDDLKSVLGSLQGLANKMKREVELKMASEPLASMEVLIERALGLAENLCTERRNGDGSGGSCGGSEGEGSGPDSGSGEGDGEGGGVSV